MALWGSFCKILQDMKPVLLMISVQIILSMVNICFKLSAHDEISFPVLMAYRFMFGSAFIVPITFFAERKRRPKLTKKVVCQSFLCGLFGGSLGQNLYFKSLALTSATFISAMTNLIPAITFLIALCLRLEKLGWHTRVGKAKVFGTILGIGGAMLLTFYKGAKLNIWHSNINLLEITSTHPHGQSHHHEGGHNFAVGAVLGLAGCVCYSIWLIIQAKVAQHFPYPYSLTAITTVWASIQGVIYTLCTERDWSKWSVGYVGFTTAAVAGVLGSGFAFTLIAWCVWVRGPLFVSIFNPLLLVIVAIVGSLFLEEQLYSGMVIGCVLIVCGLYVVLWGKAKEMKHMSKLMPQNNIQEREVEIESLCTLPENDSSFRSISRKEVEVEEDVRRHSEASALESVYVYP